jgi:hypothetical protein
MATNDKTLVRVYNTMSHIFISYSKKDIAFARHLRALLEAEGFAVWMDEAKLVPSQRWWRTIESNIKSAAAFVIVMSPNAAESDWVEREILYAERPSLNKPIFPILLEGEVWGRLANIQAQDMTAGTSARLSPTFIDALKQVAPINSGIQPPPPLPVAAIPATRQSAQQSRRPVIMGAAIGVVIVIAIVSVFGIVNLINNQKSLATATSAPTQAVVVPTNLPTATIVTAVPIATNTPSLPTIDTAAINQTATALMKPTQIPVAGNKIAFSSNRDGYYEIYMMNADGSDQKRITTNEWNDFMGNWSPDGTRLVMSSDVEGNREIFTINVDGTDLKRLTTNTTNDYSPMWSPDGSKIVFISERDRARDIYVMNADGSNQQRLTSTAEDKSDPSWMPDGSKILYSWVNNNNADIYIMNTDGSNPTRLTTTATQEISPVLSPDGSQIAYVNDSNIWVMNANGTGQKMLTEKHGLNWYPQWSPDGKRITFSSDKEGHWDIYVMNADGTNITRLTKVASDNMVSVWQPMSKP